MQAEHKCRSLLPSAGNMMQCRQTEGEKKGGWKVKTGVSVNLVLLAIVMTSMFVDLTTKQVAFFACPSCCIPAAFKYVSNKYASTIL